jgi:organic hydroperoxide reductase OsmC/OhrA
MNAEHHFEGSLSWLGSANESDGRLKLPRRFRVSFAGKPVIEGSSPSVFNGDDQWHNPETLMVASLMACHHLTYVALCERARIALQSYEDHGHGTLAQRDGKMRMVEVLLRPQVRIADPAQIERAIALHIKAHEHCFMSNSVNFDVRVEPVVLA